MICSSSTGVSNLTPYSVVLLLLLWLLQWHLLLLLLLLTLAALADSLAPLHPSTSSVPLLGMAFQLHQV